MAKGILYTLENGMSGFSKGQKRIASYIIENYDKAAFMTASKLGELSGVSESTVVRFAYELGFDGYPAMQRVLQEMIRSRLTSTQRIQAADSMLSGQDVLSSVMRSDFDKLRLVADKADRKDFDRVVDELVRARHIYILGVRSSSFVAGYLNFYMHLLLENVTLVQSNAAGEIFEQMFRIGSGDVMLAISFPPVFQGNHQHGEIYQGPGRDNSGHHGQRAVPSGADVQRVGAGAQRDDLLCGLHGGPDVHGKRPAGGPGLPAGEGCVCHVLRVGGHLGCVRRVWKVGR